MSFTKNAVLEIYSDGLAAVMDDEGTIRLISNNSYTEGQILYLDTEAIDIAEAAASEEGVDEALGVVSFRKRLLLAIAKHTIPIAASVALALTLGVGGSVYASVNVASEVEQDGVSYELNYFHRVIGVRSDELDHDELKELKHDIKGKKLPDAVEITRKKHPPKKKATPQEETTQEETSTQEAAAQEAATPKTKTGDTSKDTTENKTSSKTKEKETDTEKEAVSEEIITEEAAESNPPSSDDRPMDEILENIPESEENYRDKSHKEGNSKRHNKRNRDLEIPTEENTGEATQERNIKDDNPKDIPIPDDQPSENRNTNEKRVERNITNKRGRTDENRTVNMNEQGQTGDEAINAPEAESIPSDEPPMESAIRQGDAPSEAPPEGEADAP